VCFALKADVLRKIVLCKIVIAISDFDGLTSSRRCWGDRRFDIEIERYHRLINDITRANLCVVFCSLSGRFMLQLLCHFRFGPIEIHRPMAFPLACSKFLHHYSRRTLQMDSCLLLGNPGRSKGPAAQGWIGLSLMTRCLKFG
jgi:hypothetical protein